MNCWYTLIAYDTPSDRRRRHLVKVLEGYGERIQYSVFQAWLTQQSIDQLSKEIRSEVEPAEDSILILPIRKDVTHRAILMGMAALCPPHQFWII